MKHKKKKKMVKQILKRIASMKRTRGSAKPARVSSGLYSDF